MADLDPQIKELLEGANFISVATLMGDGAPHATCVWAAMEHGRPCFFTQPSTLKARNIDADPRVAITVIDRDNPYRSGQLRGTITETVEGDAALEIIDRMARKYTGADFPLRSGVVYLVDVSSSFLTELPFADTPG
ncbi:MAG TPA: TIGR03618 family F420-dependent PPOX class oxidoreductase [Solirubrobacterales bacterium]